MQKAKSRLQRASEENKVAAAETKNTHRPSEPRSALTRPSLVVRYLTHLPTLILSFPFAAAVYYILTRVYPTKIANVPLPNTYFLLLLPFFLCCFWLLSFVFLKARRGLFFSTLLTFYLFLRVQQVVFTWQVIVFPLMITLALELLSLFISKFTISNR